MAKRRVYICGPMRGLPNFNFAAFDAAAQRFRLAGWDVISPAEMDREAGLNEKHHPTGLDSFSFDENREFIRRDVGAVIALLRAESGDALAILPGWQNSVGATAELHLARWAKLEIRDAATTHPVTIEFPAPRVTVQYPLLDEGCDSELGCGTDPAANVVAAAEAVANDPKF